MRVIVTGAAGLIGRVLAAGLADKYELLLYDAQVPRKSAIKRLDMRRLDRAVTAFANAAAVVDLAADTDVAAPWSSVYSNNVPATMNALEAARVAGLRRFVFASSNHVIGGYEEDEPYAGVIAGRRDDLDPARLPRIDAGASIRPNGSYALGKALGEAAGRLYADRYGLSVIALRIGSVLPGDRPTNDRHRATFLSHRDLVQLVDRALQAPPTLDFGIFFGVSDNRWRIWDIEQARSALAYEPADDAERYL